MLLRSFASSIPCLQDWNEMTELVSSNGNYCSYRKAFADCVGFKIPILGVHLKDLIAVHVVFPDWINENKVNIVKMQQLSVTLSELVSLQTASHHLEPNMDLINLLTVSSVKFEFENIPFPSITFEGKEEMQKDRGEFGRLANRTDCTFSWGGDPNK